MKPTIGRIVHYVLSEHDGVHKGDGPYRSAEGQIASAIITAVWGDTCVNLQVILDGSNHGYDQRRHPDKPGGVEHIAATNRWVTSCCLDESASPAPRTWHWPPREWPDEIRNRAGELTHVGGPVTTRPAFIASGKAAFDRELLELEKSNVVKVPAPAGDKLVMADQPNEVLAIERAPNSHPADGGPKEIVFEGANNVSSDSSTTQSAPEVGLRGAE